MKNMGGLLVALVGGYFIVLGLRNTQSIVFPSLFPLAAGATAGPAGAPGATGSNGSQPTTGAGGGPGGLPPNAPIYQN